MLGGPFFVCRLGPPGLPYFDDAFLPHGATMKSRHLSYVCVAFLCLSYGACSETGPTTASTVGSTTAAAPGSSPATAGADAPTDAEKRAAATPVSVTKKPTTQAPGVKTPEAPFEGRRIALVHTANVVGELEPCG